MLGRDGFRGRECREFVSGMCEGSAGLTFPLSFWIFFFVVVVDIGVEFGSGGGLFRSARGAAEGWESDEFEFDGE